MEVNIRYHKNFRRVIVINVLNSTNLYTNHNTIHSSQLFQCTNQSPTRSFGRSVPSVSSAASSVYATRGVWALPCSRAGHPPLRCGMVQLLQVYAMRPAWFDQCMIAPRVLYATSMRDMLFFAVFPVRSHPVACSAGVGGWMLRLLPQISLWIPDPLT